MPVATLVIVPTSRGVELRREALRAPGRSRRTRGRRRSAGCQARRSSAILPLASASCARRSPTLSPATRGSPRCSTPTFCPLAVSSIPLTRSGAVSNRTWTVGREGLVERVLDRGALLRRQLERAAHDRRLGRRLRAPRPALSFAWPSISRRRRVNTSPMRSSRLVVARSVSALRAIANTSSWVRRRDGLIEVLGVVLQRLLPLRAQRVGRLPRLVEEPLALGLRLVRRLAQERGALLVELLVLVLELVALLLGLGLLRVGVGELRGDPLLPRVDGVEDRACRESASAATPG